MFIEKRQNADGTASYRARIRVAGMPQKSATFATRTQAKLWGQKMESKFREERFFPKQEEKERTFEEFIDRYIEKELPKNPKGQIKRRMHLLWWKKRLGKYFLGYIAPSMLAELRDELMTEVTYRGTLRSSSTANRYIADLSKAFNVAVREWAWLKENPLKKITRPKEGKARDRFLEKDEIQILLLACQKVKSPKLYLFVLFALSTGARKGEILNLKWDDIDFSRSVATFHETKNGETRSVPLNSNLMVLLKREKFKNLIFSGYVFPSEDGKKPADFRTAWDNAVKLSGLKNISLHSLRHTCASHLAMNGASILELQKILGHRSLAMVLRYSHLTVSSTVGALNRMNQEILGEYLNAS